MKVENKTEEYTITIDKEQAMVIWHSLRQYNEKWGNKGETSPEAKLEDAIWTMVRG